MAKAEIVSAALAFNSALDRASSSHSAGPPSLASRGRWPLKLDVDQLNVCAAQLRLIIFPQAVRSVNPVEESRRQDILIGFHVAPHEEDKHPPAREMVEGGLPRALVVEQVRGTVAEFPQAQVNVLPDPPEHPLGSLLAP